MLKIPSDTAKAIGARIRNARELAKIGQEEVAEKTGVGQSTVGRIENGDFKRLPGGLPSIAELLGVDLSEFDIGSAPVVLKPALPAIGNPFGDKTFPIYSAAEGGLGEIIRSADPVDWWPRPIEVEKVVGAYGMYIVGTSMVPEFEEGQVAVVNPHLPHISGKPFLFYAETESGVVRATVKRMRRHTEDTWFVTQHNPPDGQKEDFTLSRKLWRVAHRIVGRQDPT